MILKRSIDFKLKCHYIQIYKKENGIELTTDIMYIPFGYPVSIKGCIEKLIKCIEDYDYNNLRYL